MRRCGQSAGKADQKIGTLRDCTPGSDARASDDDTVHAPWRHGEHVNKVSVGEPADGSPPKEPSVKGGLGKVERASASRSRTSNPLIFSWLRRPSRPTARDHASTGSDASFDEVSISDASGWALLNQGART